MGNKIILFPQDVGICNAIYNGKYDVEYIHAIKPFEKEFILNFPKNYKIEGVEMHSLLVTTHNELKTLEETIEPVLNHLKLPELSSEYRVAGGEDELCIELFYRAWDKVEKKWALHRFYSPWSKLDRILRSQTLADYQSEIEQNKLSKEIALTNEEARCQFTLLKFVISLIVYAQATNKKCLKEGLPGGFVSSHIIDKELTSDKLSVFKISRPASDSNENNGNTKESHYRRWHIRQLKDERFYRGEFSHLAPGERLTFVKDSIVNKEGRPKTIVKA